MQIVRAVAVALLLVLAGTPAVASAQQGSAPPGNSGIDQYRESVPSAGDGRELSTEQRRSLRDQGRDGEELEAVLERNGGVAAPRPGSDAPAGSAADDGRDSRTSSEREPRRRSPERQPEGRDAGGGAPAGNDRITRTSDASAESLWTVRLGFAPLWVLLILVAVGCAGAAAVRFGRAR
ncbi:MAG: hypothetical protein WC558_05050 [Patulibacter sp.]